MKESSGKPLVVSCESTSIRNSWMQQAKENDNKS